MQQGAATLPGVSGGAAHRARTLARALAAGWATLFTVLLLLSGIGEGGSVLGAVAHALPSVPFILAVVFAWRHARAGGWLLATLGGLFGLGIAALTVASSPAGAAGFKLALIQLGAMLPFVASGVLFVWSARGGARDVRTSYRA